MEYRIEKDTMGEIKVPSDSYWGAQTQRSLENFRIGTEKIPIEVIRAFAILKKAAAMANMSLGLLDKELGEGIVRACNEIYSGKWDAHFPLVVWQTGSGTQSNMNVNEVVANRAGEILGKKSIHANDHVNMSQSSNDTFPTAMHIAAVIALEDKLLPAVELLEGTFISLSEENKDVIKIGRTHLQDATPITLGQEISAWAAMLGKTKQMIKNGADGLKELAIGGTAVGTGLNAHPSFGEKVAQNISTITSKQFRSASNKFHALTSKDELVFAHGAVKALAADMMKIANDVRWLASGPRCGIGEITIPENEPGSSIMPGKGNPTQCEAVTMVACQVMANDVAVSFGASMGNFQLNVFMPVCIHNFLQSVNILADAVISFNNNCAIGIKPVMEVINRNLDKSLMLVTALNPYLGYENSAKIAKKAFKEGLTLKEAAVSLGLMTKEQFEQIVRPEKMVCPNLD